MTDATTLDLDQCAREPIHVPGGIQPHGTLLVLEPINHVVLQAATNHEQFLPPELRVGAIFDDVPGMDEEFLEQLERWQEMGDGPFMRPLPLAGRVLHVTVHQATQGLILEIEEPPLPGSIALEGLYPRLRRTLDLIEAVQSAAEVGSIATAELRRLTGFDRVMLYRFDAEWNGTVIAESGSGRLPSYLDLRFPASDIPAQARELYRINRLRLIPSASYEPVAVEPPDSPVDERPLDMTMVALRSVSPVHLEYMRNMGTAASMSISIVIDGGLWGLLSCHHAEPLYLSAPLRAACDFFGQLVAQQIGSRERMMESNRRLALQRIETELVARISRETSFEAGLVANAESWLRLAGANGAAIVNEGNVLQAGETPPASVSLELAQYLKQRDVSEFFATDHLAGVKAAFAEHAAVASGVLALPVSQVHASFLLWYRPEQVRTVTWGGDPTKPVRNDGRLHPRTSFAQWKELVKGRSTPWSRVEVDAVLSFRTSIVDFILKRAEERAALTGELERSNRELESFSYSISHDLRAPFRHIVGYAQLLGERETTLDPTSRHYLNTISEAALSAGQLVDDLLNFSQLGRASLTRTRIDMNKLFSEVRRGLAMETQDRQVDWDIGRLPVAFGDPSLVRQAVHNLVENGLKYTRERDPARLTISGHETDDAVVYIIQDNGVGFDMRYVGKLFGVFQRLHRQEEFEGTGIGLALTKRVIDRHGGWIKAEGELNKGARFTFALPKRKEDSRRV